MLQSPSGVCVEAALREPPQSNQMITSVIIGFCFAFGNDKKLTAFTIWMKEVMFVNLQFLMDEMAVK